MFILHILLSYTFFYKPTEAQVITDLPESDVDISDNARVFTIVGTVCGVILCTLLVTFILLAVFMFWKRTSLKCMPVMCD